MKKYSKQRELIIENLKQRRDHPTAEKLFLDLKKQMPEIGIATVYRNLTDLCEEGSIAKIKSKTGPDRYDGNEKEHIHFECSKCNQIIDIYLDENNQKQIEKIIEEVVTREEIQLKHTEIIIQGLCKKCIDK